MNNVEAGIPEVEMSSWLALLAPAGTPRAAIDHLNTATNTALQESQLRQKIMDLGAIVYEPQSRRNSVTEGETTRQPASLSPSSLLAIVSAK